MRTPQMLLSSSALLLLAACTDKGGSGDTNDTNVAIDAPPGERVASDLGRDETPEISDETLAALTEGNRDFATDLYHALTIPGENLFFSPHSISVALAMTYAGANGSTETEMASVLGWSALPEADVHAGFNALDLALKSRAELPEDEEGDGFQLSIVNQTWGQTGYSFEAAYLDTLALNYGAAMYLLDFGADPETCRDDINGWVEDATEDRIEDLLPPGSITTDTKLVLANAIYFKSSWSEPFDTDNTSEAEFTRLDGSTVAVAMMHGFPFGAYAEGDGWALAEIPYVGDDMDMTVLVPDLGRFEEIEAGFDQAFLDAALDAATGQALDLYLPRFTFKTQAELVAPLMSLGMNAPFDASLADFSGISSSGELFISGVYHQAFVAVDEEGTEAAAATAVVMEDTAVEPGAELHVDRPFLVMVRDRPTGEILFLGRVLDPQ